MKTIWKFPIHGPLQFTTIMPEGAQILSVQVQGDAPQMWALVDPSRPAEERTFISFATGQMVPNGLDLIHLGTVQFDGGDLVFHVFEVNP